MPSRLLERCTDAPHIFRTRKCLKNGAEQKPRFLLYELKKPGMAFFSILLETNCGSSLATAADLLPSGLQRPVKIRYQVRGILYAHGDPDQTVGDSEPVALGRG